MGGGGVVGKGWRWVGWWVNGYVRVVGDGRVCCWKGLVVSGLVGRNPIGLLRMVGEWWLVRGHVVYAASGLVVVDGG